MAQDDDFGSDNDSEIDVEVAMEECWCGAVQFYIAKDRRVFCATCKARIDNTVVFTSDSLGSTN